MRVALSTLMLMLLQACGQNDSAQPPPAQPSKQSVVPAETAKVGSQTGNDNAEVTKDYTEKLFQNPFDPDAVYFLSQRAGTRIALSVLIKRDSQEGTQYSRWQFNCSEQTAQNLGVAANIQDLNKSTNSMPASPQHYESKSRLGAIAGAVCPP